jgi:hypothetical protein
MELRKVNIIVGRFRTLWKGIWRVMLTVLELGDKFLQLRNDSLVAQLAE